MEIADAEATEETEALELEALQKERKKKREWREEGDASIRNSFLLLLVCSSRCGQEKKVSGSQLTRKPKRKPGKR